LVTLHGKYNKLYIYVSKVVYIVVNVFQRIKTSSGEITGWKGTQNILSLYLLSGVWPSIVSTGLSYYVLIYVTMNKWCINVL
jgi:hypothetical protein